MNYLFEFPSAEESCVTAVGKRGEFVFSRTLFPADWIICLPALGRFLRQARSVSDLLVSTRGCETTTTTTFFSSSSSSS